MDEQRKEQNEQTKKKNEKLLEFCREKVIFL